MKIGSICYCTNQGLGILARDYHRNGIIDKVLVFRHGSYTNNYDWYPGAPVLKGVPFNREKVSEFLQGLDVVLFFETPWDWEIIPFIQKRDVKVVIMPMYEWTPDPPPHKPDLWLCPSVLDRDYFPGHPFVPVPIRTDFWKQRYLALSFLHNAGHVGYREHKGTREVLQCVQYVKSPEFRLTIRAQHEGKLHTLVRESGYRDDPRVTIQYGDVPYETLWDDHDVLLAPEKFNGLSLPLQEGYAAGMVVMTTDRYPMNTWLPKAPLIPVESVHQVRVAGPYNQIDECVVNPVTIAATIDAWVGRDISGLSAASLAWAHAHSWEVLKPRIMEALSNA